MTHTLRKALVPFAAVLIGLFTGWLSNIANSSQWFSSFFPFLLGPGLIFALGVQVIYAFSGKLLSWLRSLSWWVISMAGHFAAVQVVMTTQHIGSLPRPEDSDVPLAAFFFAGMLGALIVAAGFNHVFKTINWWKICLVSLLGGFLAVLCLSGFSQYLDLYMTWQAGIAFVLSLFLV